MASKPLSASLRVLRVKSGGLFSKTVPSTCFKVSVAYISGKSLRTEPIKIPKPWDYKKYGYHNLIALFVDRTWKRLNENSKVIVVEGMPCIGKSNLARALADELEMKYFPMPTLDHHYVNQYGHDYRQLDPKLPPEIRSFDESKFPHNPADPRTFCIHYTLWYLKHKQYMDALAHLLNTGQGVVLERCVYSENVFTDAFIDLGWISKEGKTAMHRVKTISDPMEFFMRPHLVIYLDAPVSVVHENLKRRGRGEEKAFTPEVLAKIEHNYKFDFLKRITEHAELLAYDWSTPGDAEVIVEDIERIDFDRFDPHDKKLEDWRIRDDCDWDERRWHFTENQPFVINGIMHTPLFGVPQLFIPFEHQEMFEELFDAIPGNKYAEGFNPECGDKVWFKRTSDFTEWRDFDLQPLQKQ